jgi:hypothetical protein
LRVSSASSSSAREPVLGGRLVAILPRDVVLLGQGHASVGFLREELEAAIALSSVRTRLVRQNAIGFVDQRLVQPVLLARRTWHEIFKIKF